MKRILLVICSIFIFVTGSLAQRYAVVDTKYILDKMPDYKEAQKKLDDFSVQWQKEIDTKQTELDRMYKNFEAEQVLLSDELKKKREDELFVRISHPHPHFSVNGMGYTFCNRTIHSLPQTMQTHKLYYSGLLRMGTSTP